MALTLLALVALAFGSTLASSRLPSLLDRDRYDDRYDNRLYERWGREPPPVRPDIFDPEDADAYVRDRLRQAGDDFETIVDQLRKDMRERLRQMPGGYGDYRSTAYRGDLYDRSVSRAYVQDAHVLGSRLSTVEATNSTIDLSSLTRSRVDNSSIARSNLRETVVHDSTVNASDLRGGRVDQTVIAGSRLDGVDVARSRIEESQLRNARVALSVVQSGRIESSVIDQATFDALDRGAVQLCRVQVGATPASEPIVDPTCPRR